MEPITKTLAVFHINKYGFDSVMEVRPNTEADANYVQLTEPIEVAFTRLPSETVINAQIAALDEQASEARNECASRLARIEERRAKLLALPAPAVDEDAIPF